MSYLLHTVFGLKTNPPATRRAGWTMVLDAGLGLAASRDLIATAREQIDLIKLAYGSSAFYPEAILREKLKLFRDHGLLVCPGGTLLEAAVQRNRVNALFDELSSLGFNAIEVSNGIEGRIDRACKIDLIHEACARGFRVFSEVGRKLPQEDATLSYRDRVEEIRADLKAGAEKVIMESRESGTVGIFDAEGQINSELAYELFQHIDPEDVIWEAPRRPQQIWLLHQLGPEANIGNVSTDDVLSLASLRYGLRADTLRDHAPQRIITYLELGVPGALRARKRGDVVVVVDALRASSTILQCLANGAESVTPVLGADELSGDVTLAERGGARLPGVDFSNSPTEILGERFDGKHVVISSTNGTECIRVAGGEDNPVLIGTVNNARAAARAAESIARSENRSITLLAAGRNNQPAIEDRIGVTLILKHLESPWIRGTLNPYYSDNLARDFLSSDSGMNLVSLGYGSDVLHCAEADRFDFVGRFDGTTIRRFAKTLA
ncbi:MAG TPA: hypothetical protein ENM98_00055 [Halothiobacillaceae bacterium]|nr:hypothetical protein [Halothiobacillaceae bacterium]